MSEFFWVQSEDGDLLAGADTKAQAEIMRQDAEMIYGVTCKLITATELEGQRP